MRLRPAPLLAVAFTCLFVGRLRAVEAVDYDRDIRPILSNHCFHCHGPDDAQRKGGLRLDTAAGARGAAKSGDIAIVPGRPEDSELLHRVTAREADEVMPPPEAKKPLNPAQVELLRRWIQQGAPQPAHWSFEAPRRPTLPEVAGVVHPIDRFVRARLSREGVTPSPAADRRTLIRRLSLDLIGLPPAPAEVQTFVDDRAPDAEARLVDRLLASAHFGERWGRHWLDQARYADSAGYLNDTLRPYAYLFRDWVIDAVNRDLPFDQFTVEQLAGDLLPNATREQRIATGFHRNSLKNDEAGADLELDRVKNAVDRTATTGSVWLGLTVGCAECHTHKYDPISIREFYQFYAFFNRTAERDIPAPRPDELADYDRKLAVWEKERERLETPIRDFVASLAAVRVTDWEKKLTLPPARWTVIRPNEITTITEDEERVSQPNEDFSISTGERDPVRTRYVVQAPLAMNGVTGFRVEALAGLGERAGRTRSGEFHLAEFSVMARTPVGEQRKLEFSKARADFAAKGNPPEHTLDGDSTTGWAVTGQGDRGHVIVFELKEPQNFSVGTTLFLELEHRITGVMTRFRIAATTGATPLEPSTLPDEIIGILDTPAEQRTPESFSTLARHVARFDDAKGKELFKPLAAHHAKRPEYPKTAAPVLIGQNRPTRIHLRGDYKRPGEEVSPGTPAVLPPLRARGPVADRLDLARWIVDPANPLTARVAVNQIWKSLFGRGLVATPDNFGSLGERPSHPELLDWLATEFVRLGWSRKALIRLIVSSETYRQSSRGRADLGERDPLNIMLARQSRHRLEAEIVRDVALASSGLLNPRIGGPSIHPPLPEFVMAFGRNRSWPETKGAEANRRGMYIHLRRNVPYPMLTTFDASDASVTCLQRERSNSPLQALTLLNDPVFFAAAGELAKRLEAMPGESDERLRAGFELCLGRPPSPAELQALRRHHSDQLAIAGGDERLALISTARLLLNLDEFITRE